MRQFLLKFSGTGWRCALGVLLVLYFVLGLTLLGLRFGLAPYIDTLRPQIAAQISQLSGTQTSLSAIQLAWRGWNPQIEIQGLRLADAQDQTVLQVPLLRASWAWFGAKNGLRLQVQGMDISLGRLPDGRLHLMGHVLDVQPEPDDPAQPATLPAWLRWVLAQPQITFRDTTLRWHDQSMGTPALVLNQVHAVLQQQAGQAVGMSLSAQAPAIDHATLDMRLRVDDGQLLAQGHLPASWQAWFRLSHAHLPAWRPWLGLPDALQRGRLAAQFWLQSGAADARITALLDVADFNWAFGGPQEGLQIPHAALWLQGGLNQWQGLVQDIPLPQGLAFDLMTQGVRLQQAAWFEHALDTGRVALRGQLRRDAFWALQLQDFSIHNADIQLQGEGSWDSRGEAGQVDLHGTIAQAQLNAIHRYLPLETDADARHWLAKGLQAGTLRQAQWRLSGDLVEFPFGDHPQAGDFRVAGHFDGARINFVPDASPSQAWPVLQDIQGTADLHRMDLQLWADQAQMQPQPGKIIHLSGLRARIPDLENESILQVSGQTAADGAVYMDLLRHSPIGALLDGFFDESVAAGNWQVPLSLTIPLNNTDASQVWGRVDIQQGRLVLMPQAPALEAITGRVHFTETGVRLVQPLAARMLGGQARLSGSLGGKAAQGLVLQGRVSAKALDTFVGVPGMRRVSGNMDYQLKIQQQGRAYVATLGSDTQGLALDFPSPLAKAAEQARRLQVRWTNADPRSDQLDIRWGDEINLSFQHSRKLRQGPYFQQVLVSIGQAADATAPGLRVAFHYPLIDLDLWNRIVDEFSIPRRNQADRAGAGERPLWPDLSLLSVQADQMRMLSTRLDQAVLRATRTPQEFWSLNLRSQQTTGTLKWQERDGQVTGRMSGRFSRLSVGDDANDTGSLLPDAQVDDNATVDDDLDLPGIVLQADELRLFGHSVGALSLEGVRDAAQHTWRLDRLKIGDDHASLQGTGLWRLRGPDRGLGLKANVVTKNLGAWMARAGYPDVLVGGEGTLKGDVQWHDLPWTRNKADLQGSLTFSLDKGRFQKVGSHTAKLLEILSLQSITRLGRLDQSLVDLSKDGFPFDQLRGTLALDKGLMQAQDYKVIGPVATILLEGRTNILDETLNLQAVIVPNLDVSGAALAAGIAINPLVGLGAFVTQWLLKTPLAKAMTVRYHVTGTWDDPIIQDTPINAAAASSDAG